MLTDAAIKQAEPKPKPYKLHDRDGLYLYVRGTSKTFRYDYRLHGKRRTLTIGRYKTTSLAKARTALDAARQLVAEGKDPSQAKRAARVQSTQDATFGSVAAQWLEQRRTVLAPATVEKKVWQLDAFLRPALGAYRLKDITPALILGVLKRIERQGHHETAHRTLQLCGQVLRYAVAHDLIERDVSADLKGTLTPVVAVHHPALTEPSAVGGLMRAIASLDTPRLRSALRLLALTFVRPGELRQAEWKEFDRVGAIWRIPAARTKQRKEHLVPLSRQALEELDTLETLSRGSDFVLPSPRTIKRTIVEQALLAALARIGYEDLQSAHGFRATARTLLDERLGESPDVIEAQMGHVTRGALRDTYNRSRYLQQRATMMQRWADYLDELTSA